ncbi:MAG TPA: hypothetical protein VGG48_16775 [Rhizomicrobium sp.]|jgi:hypothetical protein
MLTRIFPKLIDNRARGHWLAIWILVPIVLLKLVIGTNSILNTRMVAISADGIPIGSFDPGGAQAVIGLFALLGLSQLLVAFLGATVLIRYRAMIPFMYLLLLFQQLGGKAMVMLRPVTETGEHDVGSAVILAILALTVIGFALSLLGKPAPENP